MIISKKYALISEIIGGIAIVFSLLVVSYQISLSTSATKAATEQALMEEINNWRLSIGDTEDKAFTFLHPESQVDQLTEKQLMQRMANLDAFWGIQESAFMAYEVGILDDNSWERFYRVMCTVNRRGFPPFNREFHDEDFLAQIDNC